MQAADIMTVAVVTATPELTVREAARIMLENGVSALPVINSDGRLVGIVSEGDLVRRAETGTELTESWWLGLFTSSQTLQERFVKSHGQSVGDVMTLDPIVVTPKTPVAEIADILEKHRIKRVPVTENGRIRGIVSRANLLHALASSKSRTVAGSKDDRTLREAVLAAFADEAGLGGVFVNVTVKDGAVRLWGTVRSDTEERALFVAARSVPGVASVESNLGRVPEWVYGY